MEYQHMSSYRALVASTTAILSPTQECPDKQLSNTQFTVWDHRLYIVQELFATERVYLAHLQAVLEDYAEPFRKFTSMSADEHKVLFVSLEPIISITAMVISKLNDAIGSWDGSSTKVGNLFSSKFWNHYNDYAEQYNSTIKRKLEEKFAEDESFVEFLELRRGSSEFTLDDLLQLPVQRIPEYDKYLNELLQETDPGHPDYDHLKRAADKVRQMVKEREDELENMDNTRRMERVQDKFPYDDLQLRNMDLQKRQLASRRKSAPGAVLFKTLGKSRSANNLQPQSSMGRKEAEIIRRQYNNFNRQYLMEGNVEFSRGMQTQDRYLFLFSDLLLVAKQKSNTTFKLKHRLRVCELWIADCIDDISELTRPKERSFVLGWPTTNYVATFKSVELKDTWLIKLKEQIEDERGKSKPEQLPLQVHHKENETTCPVDVERDTDARTIIRQCLNQLQIPEHDENDYQLWVRLGPDESPYPLCGHELPYAIKLSHIRDFGNKRDQDSLTEPEIRRIMEEMQNNNRKYEFFLKHKKSQKRQSIEENTTKPNKTKRKFTIFRRNRDDKKPHGKLFSRTLEDVTTPEALIAKPVKELLTILFREGPFTVGILRKSCNAKMLKELRQRLDDGEDCLSSDTWQPLVIGAIIKDYLRSIPKSLLSEDLFDDWIAANGISDAQEKTKKLQETIEKLPPANRELLRHLMCVLHHIDRKSEENKMTAYNLSVCIAPSLLWPKGNPDPLLTPPAVLQFMIENCGTVFGTDAVQLFGDFVEQKMRQDSSTDSDSMHSVLSSHSNFRRDDSSIDSLDREGLYTVDLDSSPHVSKSHHFSPSNLSGDSGLISDSQFYDEDTNGNDITGEQCYSRSNSHFLDREMSQEDLEPASRSHDSQFFYHGYDPVPPPRRQKRRGLDNSPNMEYDRRRYVSQANHNVPALYERRMNNHASDKFKRMSTESLKSVEEGPEAEAIRRVPSYKQQEPTLVKSASGAHLYIEDITLYQFNNINNDSSRRRFCKQSSDGALMSPQSKYSLSSSRDSVLSDSSGSYLNRQNSPDPLSSSAETPEQEDRGMSDWLNQQSRHTAFSENRQSRISHDDSEVGLKSERNTHNSLNYLVSPKTSPKIRRRSPIPLEARRSYPIQSQITPKGSGSNTSKEAEDIIQSPKLSVTYCSQDSLDRRDLDDDSCKDKFASPHLDLYNNNKRMKQLNIYASGLQGTSPPPRVVLQELASQAQVKKPQQNKPLKGNHTLLMESDSKMKYPMEESSVSSEDEDDVNSKVEPIRVPAIRPNVPLKFPTSKPVVEHRKSASDSSSHSTHSDEGGVVRPENPPAYYEAVQRNRLLKQGLSPGSGSDTDTETIRQREASLHAKQLYEQSMRQYQEKEEVSLPSSKQFIQKLDSHTEESSPEDTESVSSEEEEEPRYNPHKIYEESLKRFQEEQNKQFPLSVTGTSNTILLSKNKGDSPQLLSPHGSSLHRSSSDVGDVSRSPSANSRTSSNDSTPTRRPSQPPPYNDPPPYRGQHRETSPTGARRHLFPKAGENVYQSEISGTQTASAKTVPDIAIASDADARFTGKAENLHVIQRRKDNSILVSSRSRNTMNSVPQNRGYRIPTVDHTVKSAQMNYNMQYRSPVTNIRACNSPSNTKQSSVGVSVTRSSTDVFKPRSSSVEPNDHQNGPAHPPVSSQGAISYRNPQMNKSSTNVTKSQSSLSLQTGRERRGSLDAAVMRPTAQKDLPWSVKRLSNIFDTVKVDTNSTSSNSSSRPSPSTSSSARSTPVHNADNLGLSYNDTFRSNASSSSSQSSVNTGYSSASRSPIKGFTKFGPQARDSFSSTDESECSCRYSLSCRRDNSSVEELTDPSLTDITYV
ncbi:uncharacterized protein LOC128237152 isoform X3 [Mya arenaria]|nr:uncharacterized protein LOC128237152 isoform X3 [Mya arenaria]